VKLDQVPYGQIESLRLRWTSASGALPNAAVPGAEALLQFSEREAQATLRVGGDVLGVQGDGRKHEVLLDDLGTRHFPRIAWVVDAGPQVLTLQVHTFLHALTLPPIELGVDEKVLEALERIDRKLASPERALQWLDEQFLLDGESGRRGFATAESNDRSVRALWPDHARVHSAGEALGLHRGASRRSRRSRHAAKEESSSRWSRGTSGSSTQP
jgi:hypothetical protein